MEEYIVWVVGFILIVFGGLNVVRPDIMVRFQIWSLHFFHGRPAYPKRKNA